MLHKLDMQKYWKGQEKIGRNGFEENWRRKRTMDGRV
jgi:hypothetical protein